MPLHSRWQWLPAFTLSLFGHAAVFWLADQYVAVPGLRHDAERVMSISIVQQSAPKKPAPAPALKQPVVRAKRKQPPVRRHQSHPHRQQRQHHRLAIRHAAASQASVLETRQSQLPAISDPPQVQQVARHSDPVAKTATMPRADASATNGDERKHYIERLMAHIEAFKRYPRRARRRHQEGDVEVSLRLNSDGSVASMTAHGGTPGLRKASLRAVADARPLPPPPAHLAAPVDIRFIMRFRLH